MKKKEKISKAKLPDTAKESGGKLNDE